MYKVASKLSMHHVNYLVTGGVAEVLMGEKTTTFDIDIVIENEPMNIERFKSAISALHLQVSVRDICLFSENNLLRIYIFPYTVDFLPRLDGLDLRTCFENKVMFRLDDIVIPVITMDLLKTNKEISYQFQRT